MDDELLIKYLLRETRQDEDRKVELWLAASESHRKQFSNLELIWNTSKKLATASTINEDEAWERFKAKTVSIPQTKPVKLWARYGWMKIAAALVLVCGAWMMFNLMGNKNKTLTAYQQTLNQSLPDGSSVILNKNSVLSYSFDADGGDRNVKLERGEVFFHVAPDKQRPFIIETDGLNIEVVGTSFNVKHTESLTEVIVETGIVKVSKGEQVVELHKGEKVTAREGKLTLLKNTDLLYNYYRSNEFVADNTPLWRLVEVLNEAYQAEIRIENPALRNVTLTTRFQNESLDRILQIVGETINCEVIRRGNSYILK
ncbi:FecR family protein [Arcticibacter pallidicorallinus]|uniref:FecR family protein n=1 Tax=Arcticibacter pallidicorallinus TaxID=1259464 RepID=A0A2T0UB99_9SPHI|nr:FecR domain-containing protein [Arcticibacter pallidicorallinus]PRY55221.1 FecR family protein [Arcticibacter pallidicorallinus]